MMSNGEVGDQRLSEVWPFVFVYIHANELFQIISLHSLHAFIAIISNAFHLVAALVPVNSVSPSTTITFRYFQTASRLVREKVLDLLDLVRRPLKNPQTHL